MSRWTDWIKDYAKKNNMSYGCAMTDKKMRELYYKKFPKKTKEELKEDKKQADSKLADQVKRNILVNFKSKFVKPYLADKNNKILKNNMVKKYNGFANSFKEFVKENAPKIFKLVNDEDLKK